MLCMHLTIMSRYSFGRKYSSVTVFKEIDKYLGLNLNANLKWKVRAYKTENRRIYTEI